MAVFVELLQTRLAEHLQTLFAEHLQTLFAEPHPTLLHKIIKGVCKPTLQSTVKLQNWSAADSSVACGAAQPAIVSHTVQRCKAQRWIMLQNIAKLQSARKLQRPKMQSTTNLRHCRGSSRRDLAHSFLLRRRTPAPASACKAHVSAKRRVCEPRAASGPTPMFVPPHGRPAGCTVSKIMAAARALRIMPQR